MRYMTLCLGLVALACGAGKLEAGDPQGGGMQAVRSGAVTSAEAGAAGDRVRLERPLGWADLGGCFFFRGALRLPRTYSQAQDGRIVIEAEDAASYNIGSEDDSVGPFAASEQNVIGDDRQASLNRYILFAQVARWERAQWKIAVAKACKLTAWYRIFIAQPGEYAHTELLNGKGPSERVVTFNSNDPNHKALQQWQWVQGPAYDFVAGANLYVIDWHNGARLDQIAFLPAGVQPQGNEIFAPTSTQIQPSATATTKPIRLAADEQAERLLAQTDVAGGQVKWEMSSDGGKTWHAIPEDGTLSSANMKSVATLTFRVKLAESAQHVSPIVQGVRLVISKPRPMVDLQPLPPSFQYHEKTVALIPATWEGARWRSGAWTLAEPIQPDAQGILWMDAAKADYTDLLPESRSWIGEVTGSVSGKSVRQGLWNRNLLSFDVNVPKKDQYRPWFRVQLAREVISPSYHPSVYYQVDRQPIVRTDRWKWMPGEQGKDYPCEAYRKREWVWLPGKEIELDAGPQTFRLRGGLDYSWLDRVCLAPTNAPAPQGTGGTSVRAMVTNATVTFQPLTDVMAKSWKDVQSESPTKGGRLTYSFSKDGGKTWVDLKDNILDALGGGEAAKSNVTLRCTLAPDAEGKPPCIAAWKAVAKEAGEPLIQLANREQKIVFDPATGDLLGWWSERVGWMVPPGRRQPLFEVGLPQRSLKSADGQLLRRATTLCDGTQVLSLEYLMEGGSILTKIRIELPEKGLSRWKMTVENHSQLQIYGLTFPIIGGLRIGDEAEANRAPNCYAGFGGEGNGKLFTPAFCAIYPGLSMGWYTLLSKDLDSAFTLQTRNQDAYHIWMTDQPDSAAVAMEYRFARMIVVDPESKGEAEYELGWHAGDWHRSADLYREWARSWMKTPEIPAWVKKTDGWLDCGALIASRYFTHGWPRMEWFGADYSMYWWRSIDGGSGGTFPYWINPRMGTAADFRRAHAAARAKGWHNGYYVQEAWSDDYLDAEFIDTTPRRLLPKEIRLRPRGFVEKWGMRNADGSLAPRYSYTQWCDARRMCGTGWQDMMVDAFVHNTCKVLGADVIYIDEGTCRNGFCFGADHGHGTQRAVWPTVTLEGLRRVLKEARRENPDFAIVGEGLGDQYMQYMNFGLWFGYTDPFQDGNVFQYTFPEVKLVKGHLNSGGAGVTFGEYARHLNLFLVNNLLGNLQDLKEFYAHRKRIGDWMHGGVFQDNVGLTISEPGIEAKWFRRDEKGYLGAAVNIHNEDRIASAVLRLKWPELRNVNRALAYLWGGEVKPLPMRWDNDGAVVEIPSAQASTILLIAKEPQNEAVRGHCFWPLGPGPDKLILVLANTSDKNQTVKLAWNAPAGVTLKSPPAQCDLPAGEVARLEVIMAGIATMKQRGRVEVQVRGPSKFTASCVVAPPVVNGGFEVDSMGNGTPDMWGVGGISGGIPILTQILRLKELPPIVHNGNEVIHHADGFIDNGHPAEGKNALLLPGRLMLPYTWCRNPDDKSPIPNQPFYFQTGQQLILKPGTRYHLSCKHRQEASDGFLEMSANLNSYWEGDSLIFPIQTIPAAKGDSGWQSFNFDFTTPKDLAGPPDLCIANKGAGKAWLDAFTIEELGPAD